MKIDKSNLITKSKKIVIKIGTSILTDIVNGKPEITIKNIQPIVKSINKYSSKKSFTLVSSGAIGFGMSVLNMKTRPKKLSIKQAAASVGQNKMMYMYDRLFKEYSQNVAQILLTQTGIMDRQKYLNAINTLNELFKLKVIPIVNENDTVAVDEIKFGDNDKLAAMVSSMINSDLLILLTNIKGLLKNIRDENSLIEDVYEINDELLGYCGSASKSTTTGGMSSKLNAAEIVMKSGIPMIICDGNNPNILNEIMENNFKGTFFYPEKNVIAPRKRWIKFNLKPCGKIFIDDGAADAVYQKHKSLLPSGITKVIGNFEKGDCVSVHAQSSGKKLAAGLVNYNNLDLNQIKGLKSSQIKNVLGYMDYNVVIHTDNLVL